MANLKEIRNRIASVSSTMQITSAMKMVSAAKLKKAQDVITAMRPYANTLTELIQNLSSQLEGDNQNPYTQLREKKNVLIVAITSNRGLCGAFNANIIKKTRQLISEDYANQKVSLITIGKKGSEVLEKTGKIEGVFDAVYDDLNYESVGKIAQEIMDQFALATYDEVIVVYNRFKNAATQIVQAEPYLPIVAESNETTSSSADYIFEPSKADIVNDLLPKSLKMQLYKAVRDSFASEHGARMTAMHKATDNATELRDQLKLTYNKARQAAITNEILEIVGGAEALNG
ncbi:ATP synthase F1 subunit gamma [Flavobacteriaceae bacterium]|nr:ATP synthase F1 subunit gamma [Flavobacteriaceae bacterium]MDA9572270.1 ATP synthase F1 subunit gamma [Flavobacteriaceae bacterium]MDB3862530.1 ATP synthase F1 subunit gamma [Flavobacteriaceae bacterium]